MELFTDLLNSMVIDLHEVIFKKYSYGGRSLKKPITYISIKTKYILFCIQVSLIAIPNLFCKFDTLCIKSEIPITQHTIYLYSKKHDLLYP